MNLLTHESKMKLFQDRPESTGPKWAQKIQDVSRRNQTLSNQAQQDTNHGGIPHNRLMMKLMNIHSSCDQGNSQGLLTGPSQREAAKRFALDDCTNFLQQKTLQQNYPSASQALQNIINSNRSASSTGFHAGTNIPTSKTFQSFKFNLTLNKHRTTQPNQKLNEQAPGSNNFYPSTSQADTLQYPNGGGLQGYDLEDNEAMVQIQDQRVTSKTRAFSKPKQIKTYDERQTEDDGGMLDFDQELGVRVGRNKSGKRQGGITNHQRDYLGEMEDRQRIFEEEIIKRVKEIQSYAKNLHLQIKKMQQTQSKRQDDWNLIQEQLIALKDNLGGNEINEQALTELLTKKFEVQDSETQIQLESLETKINRDSDQRLQKLTKQILNDVQIKLDQQREEIMSQIQDEVMQNQKQELTRIIKDSQKSTDKQFTDQKSTITEISSQINEVNDQTEQMQGQMQSIQQKIEKILKQIKDDKSTNEDQFTQVKQEFEDEMASLKKKITKDLKLEFDTKQFVTFTDLNDQIEQINSKLSQQKQSSQLLSPSQHQDNSQRYQEQINEIEEKIRNLESDVLSKINELNESDIELSKKMKETQKQQDERLTQNIKTIEEKISNVQNSLTDKLQKLSEKNENDLNKKSNDLITLISDTKQEVDKVTKNQQKNEQRIQSVEEEVETLKYSQNDNEQEKVDEDSIAQNVISQLKPNIDKQNETIGKVNEQVEQVKVSISQRVQRQELQEIKSDLDSQIDALHKNIKKIDQVDEKQEKFQRETIQKFTTQDSLIDQINNQLLQCKDITGEERSVVHNNDNAVDRDYINEVFEEINQDVIHLKEKLQQYSDNESQNNRQIKEKLERINNEINDLKNETNETKESITEIKEQMSEIRESSVGREDLEELQNELKILQTVKLQQQIPHQQQNIEQSIQKEEVETMIKERIQQVKSDISELIDNKILEVTDQIYESSQNIEQLQEEVGNLTKTDENLNNEINEIKSQLIQLQSTAHTNHNDQTTTEQFEEDIHNIKEQTSQQQQLISQIQQDTLLQVSQIAQQSNSHIQRVEDDLKQTQFTYDLCFSSIQKDIPQLRDQISEVKGLSLNSQIEYNSLNELFKHHVHKMEEIEQKQQQLKQTVVDNKQSHGQSLNSVEQRLSHDIHELKHEITAKYQELSENIEKLKEMRQFVPTVEIQRMDDNMQNNRMSSPNEIDVSNIKSARSNHNFLGSASKDQNNNNYQAAHFLEELSEVEESLGNKLVNQTDDGEMMMFNNKTQSLGASSIMSNKLNVFSPVEQKQFTFNQQVAQKLEVQKDHKEMFQVTQKIDHSRYEDEQEEEEVDIQHHSENEDVEIQSEKVEQFSPEKEISQQMELSPEKEITPQKELSSQKEISAQKESVYDEYGREYEDEQFEDQEVNEAEEVHQNISDQDNQFDQLEEEVEDDEEMSSEQQQDMLIEYILSQELESCLIDILYFRSREDNQ